MQSHVGIVGLAMFAPPDVRTNDWWPADVVARWIERRASAPPPAVPESRTPGMQRVLEQAATHAGDPFQGAVERRVLAASASVLDMEERAARTAIESSGIDPASIDLLLTHEVVPDHQLVNPACSLHHRLGLSTMCLSLHVEATANTVFGQLALAEAAIASGRASYALLTQSCAATRLVERDDPSSPVLGDGATAMVLGRVAPPRGLLAMVHGTDGRYPRSLMMSVPGGRWYDEGRVRVHVGDAQQLYEGQLRTADVCGDAVGAVLRRCGHAVEEVDFWCVFQGTAWMDRAILDHLGVRESKRVELFRRFGYLSSAAIPATLYLAAQEGRLADGDLVVLTGGGTGMTYGAAVLRWGVS